MPTSPDTFTVTCNGIGAIGIDYVDLGTEPDEDVIYAFCTFRPRLPAGTTIWAPGLTPPRGIVLDDVKARFSPEDGKLRTIIAGPVNEKQRVTLTGPYTGGTFTLTYSGQTTSAIAFDAAPAVVQTALEALSNIEPGDVYVSGSARNEKQTVAISGAPDGGTFLLTFGGYTTTPIPRMASAATVKAALQALPSIGGIGCAVSGNAGGPWEVEFTGALAGVNVAALTSAPRSEQQLITLTKTPTAGDFALSFSGQTTSVLAYNASAATVQTALEALSNIAPGDVAVGGNAGGPYTVAFAAAWANQQVPQIIGVQRNEVQTVSKTGTVTGGTFTLSYNGIPTTAIWAFASSNQVRQALEDLPNVEPGDVAVVGNWGGPWTITFRNNLGERNVPMLTANTANLNGSTPGISIIETTPGIGLTGATTKPAIVVTTSVEHAALTGGTTPTVGITTTQVGSAGSPYTVTFQGLLAATDVAAMTGSGASLTPSGGVLIETLTTGGPQLGVKLVANTTLIDLDELIYDVELDVPNQFTTDDTTDKERYLRPFAIMAPTTTGQTLDLATVPKLPHRSELGDPT